MFLMSKDAFQINEDMGFLYGFVYRQVEQGYQVVLKTDQGSKVYTIPKDYSLSNLSNGNRILCYGGLNDQARTFRIQKFSKDIAETLNFDENQWLEKPNALKQILDENDVSI